MFDRIPLGRTPLLAVTAIIMTGCALFGLLSYGAGVGPPTIFDLQPSQETQEILFRSEGKAPAAGAADAENATAGQAGEARLVNLNSNINAWYVMSVRWPGQRDWQSFHLESAAPGIQRLSLIANPQPTLVVATGPVRKECPMGARELDSPLHVASTFHAAFFPICDGAYWVRNRVTGNKSAMETMTDFLRTSVPGGETITDFVKDTIYKDAFDLATDGDDGGRVLPLAPDVGGVGLPLVPALAEAAKSVKIAPLDLGLTLEGVGAGSELSVGRWYPVHGHPGVFVNALTPHYLDPAIFATFKDRVNTLDSVESKALVYGVAFDLDVYRIGFALGTDHPRLEWSDRALPSVRVNGWQGPDGFKSGAPLVATGLVNPSLARTTIATFAGGFKRYHAAFRHGLLSQTNHGSHYGFMENGVVFSKLVRGLSSMVIRPNGMLEMRTWGEKDDAEAATLLHVRQNGVPLIELGEDGKTGVPGRFVNSWELGNWSGSTDESQRSLRSGACLQAANGKHFLIYGYFSTATPSAMARVFQAYACQHAMHLDMNALEHTYLSLLSRDGDATAVEHLIKGMNVLDKKYKGRVIPRFVGYSDNRDFFYLYPAAKDQTAH